jgi:hypothetical protein
MNAVPADAPPAPMRGKNVPVLPVTDDAGLFVGMVYSVDRVQTP